MRVAAEAAATAIHYSIFLRHFRNLRRYPGLVLHPTVHHSIAGHFAYGKNVSVGSACNLIVPKDAKLIIGDDCYLGRNVELGPHGRIELGAQVSIQDRSILVGDVSVGRYCVISLNVLMTSGTHYFNRWPHLLIRDQDSLVSESEVLNAQHNRPISIGEDCWLGMNSVIMPGVTIGRGCAVGANAVVTRDLPPYSVATGVPARITGRRLEFSPPSRIEWKKEEHIPYFYSGFALTRAERQQALPLGGHVARARFSLYLASGGSEIRMLARTEAAEKGLMESGGTQEHLTRDWKECRFPAGESPATSITPDVPVVVSAAWIV